MIDGQHPAAPCGKLAVAGQKRVLRFPQFFPQRDGNLASVFFALYESKNKSFLPHLNLCLKGFEANLLAARKNPLYERHGFGAC
jgi:hypothetical protein